MKKRKPYKPRKEQEKVCLWCQAKFKAKASNAKTCGPNCRQIVSRLRRRLLPGYLPMAQWGQQAV